MIKPGDIIIKGTNVLIGLMERNFHPLLIIIICEIIKKFGIRMSESYREPRHSGDVHATNPVRAVDISSWVYSEKIARQIEIYINKRWEYDPRRPKMLVARIHKVKDGVFHFHIQVHPRTRRR